MFDLRPFVDRYGLPESLEGMRCLDVGTWDGFWAFEMERRGGEVVGIDLDDERAARLAAAPAAEDVPRGAARRELRGREGGARVEGRAPRHLDLRRDARGARHVRLRLLRVGPDPPARPAAGARADCGAREGGGTFVSAEAYWPRAARLPVGDRPLPRRPAEGRGLLGAEPARVAAHALDRRASTTFASTAASSLGRARAGRSRTSSITPAAERAPVDPRPRAVAAQQRAARG